MPPTGTLDTVEPSAVAFSSEKSKGLASPKGTPFGANELQIGDKVYALTDQFIRKHPGGTVIKSKLGTNATQAFNEFHTRSQRARKWLNNLPSRPAPAQDPMLEDFDRLREEFVKDGMFKFAPLHVIYRFAEIIGMTLLGYKLVMLGWYWTGMFILGITSGRCGWLQHEGNHNSLTGVQAIDKFLGSMVFSLGEAGSATWWISSHNRHHASPQHVGYDSDLNTLPAMAFDSVTARMGNPKWLKFQAWTFEFSTWLVVLYWKLYLHPIAIWRKKAVSDGVFLVLHYVIFWWAFQDFGLLGVIGTHLVWGSVAGSYLFTNFALSHTHKPVITSEEHEDWVRSAILRTTNIKHNALVNWWMGYLNMQIEHHLFPNMPQFRHVQIADRVKAFAKKWNLDYDERGYWEVVACTFRNLDVVGHEHSVGSDLKVRKSKKAQ